MIWISQVLLISIGLLSGCASATTASPEATQAVPATPDVSSPPVDTPVPSPPLVFLAADAVSISPSFSDSLTTELRQSGFEVLHGPASALDADPSRVVYILASSEAAVSVREEYADIPLLILNPTTANEQSNQSLVLSNDFYQQTAFLAGYSAAILTSDYRTGFLGLAGSEIPGIYDSFASGMTYFCGLCSPRFPPFIAYPVYVQISEPFTTEKIAAARDALTAESVSTVYLHPSIQSEELYTVLHEAEIAIFTNQGILQSENSLASLVFGPDMSDIVQLILPAVSTGSMPDPVSPAPAILHNSIEIGEGRFRHLEEIIQLLSENSIIPFE